MDQNIYFRADLAQGQEKPLTLKERRNADWVLVMGKKKFFF